MTDTGNNEGPKEEEMKGKEVVYSFKSDLRDTGGDVPLVMSAWGALEVAFGLNGKKAGWKERKNEGSLMQKNVLRAQDKVPVFLWL